MTFDEAFERILGLEGKYSNHSADKGGETMWGITWKVARAHGYQGPMQHMPTDVAKAIYRKSYWDAAGIDMLPADVRFVVFDGAVNSGVVQSVRWLQRAVGAKSDGVIGPRTLEAVRALHGARVTSRYNGHRLQFMAGLSDWGYFGKGWANRIANNLLDA